MRPTLDPAALWDNYRPTTLLELSDLARQLNVGRVFAKLENERPLGNFKAPGGMTAGLKALAGHPAAAAPATQRPQALAGQPAAAILDQRSQPFAGKRAAAPASHPAVAAPAPLPTLICASEGNHGLSVAAAAARAGTKATVFLPSNANPIRADRIKAIGGEIHWIDGTYDDAVEAAAAAAARGEGLLIPDTSPEPNDPVVKDVMTGYGLITQELRDQLPVRPTHLFVQAGVGGLAAAMVDGLHDFMSAPHRILIVEPESAACVSQALIAGHPVLIPGPLQTSAEMLACGLASAPAIEILKQHNVRSLLVSEDHLQAAPVTLQTAGGPPTTPSGAAGLAGLLYACTDAAHRANHHLTPTSTVLLIITEAAASSTR
jgi:diaminopropionate ammonia-lyase